MYIDVALGAIMILIIVIGMKRGFIKTIFDLGAGLIAFLIAKLAAPGVASAVYSSFVKGSVIDILNKKYAETQEGFATAIDSFTGIFDFLPKGVVDMLSKNGAIDSNSISQSVLSNITTVEQLESEIVAPVIQVVLIIVCFAVIALVSTILLRIVGSLISKLIKKISLADKVNMALGGAVGVLKAALYTIVLASIINVVALTSESIASYAAQSQICLFVAMIIGF